VPRGDRAFDLAAPRRIHVVGIGGAGMSAIAGVLARMGHAVSGSDIKPSVSLERLRGIGVAVHVGHDPSLVDGVDAVTISTAIPDRNPEVRAAIERGITVLRRAEMLATIAATRRTIAVAGTHGKTTTASMLALTLARSGMRPSFIIGGEVNDIGGGAAWDTGEWFVVEADESDGTFLLLPAEVALVTNVEPDHLEHYGSVEGLERAFARFLGGPARLRIVGADDPVAAQLGREVGAVTYGETDGADYRVAALRTARDGVEFRLVHRGEAIATVHVPVPGRHNALNAAGAIVTAIELGASPAAAARALAHYGGVARRFEYRGERDGVTFVDDYAHLPGEVRAALATARGGGWSRVVCAFQPHRYSRTAMLWQDFGSAFDLADLLVVTDIYAAGEAPRPGVSGRLVVQAVLEQDATRRVAWLPRRSDVISYLRRELRAGDVCLTLGAGDLTSVPGELLAGG
jgi:UDP-N-acetylmuramate--alanine ligase